MKGSSEHPDQIVYRVMQAIADYQEGLARIDREFNAAASRREQTLQGLRKDLQTPLAASTEEALRRLADEERQTNASRAQRRLHAAILERIGPVFFVPRLVEIRRD